MNGKSKKASKIKNLFGAQVVKAGFATPDQVLNAVEEQNARRRKGEKHLKLGKLMLEKGIINASQLRQIVSNTQYSPFNLSDDAIQLAVRIRSDLDGITRVIMLTGADTNEVSELTFQIAYAMAMMEFGSVLLMDMNFRSPSYHHLIDSTSTTGRHEQEYLPGLSDILAEKISYSEAIYDSGAPFLSVLPCGNIAVDFLSLLLSEELTVLLRQLREKYLVIINSPPASIYPDASMIAPKTDGMVLVAESGVISTIHLRSVKESFEGLGVRIIGVILSRKQR